MKKRRFALSALLIMSVVFAMILSIMPMSVLAADAAAPALVGTKLTTAHAGQTLAAGEYYVEPGATLTLRGGTGKSGLTVAANSTVTIHIPAGSTLNVYGGAASGTTGAGAGIEVVSGSNLKIIGSGTLNAYGGKAANGSNGARGETATWGDDSNTYIPDSGYGGSGGGGAGAGIGTKGGKGGSGTSWTLAMGGRYYRSTWTDDFKNKNVSGSNGQAGGDGATASDCGGIFVQPGVTVKAVGGNAGTSGGSGGSAGSKDYESDDHWMRGLAGGAGGGGGGAGKKGANIGTGGGGGGGGGAGGGIGYAWSYSFLGAGGGGGGAGAVGGGGGAWSSDGEIPDCKKYSLYGGRELTSLSGSSGGKDIGGSGGRGAKVKIMDWSESYWQWPYAGYGGKGGNAGSDCSEEGYQALYTVSIDDGDKTTVYYASADKFLPTTLAVQNKTGYTFKGYYGTNDVQYYDENGTRTSAKISGNVTISAKLDVNEYDYTINRNPDSSGSSDTEMSGSVEYGSSITLTTPNREGYLFRGWKISASSGNLNKDAYYTYTAAAPVMRMMMRSSNRSSNQSFVQYGDSFLTAGIETIGNSVTLYNLSADNNAQLMIEEMWVPDYFKVTFKDFDGAVIGTQEGKSVDALNAPAIPNNTSEYYTYTFKHWKCNIDGNYYTTEELPNINMGKFLSYESKLGDEVYTGITFTAVYDIEYKKELHFVGSLGNQNLDKTDPNFPNGVLILGEGNTNVPVITNFKIAKNDGVSSLLLIPQYDASVFNIKEIYINGHKVYYGGLSMDPPTVDSTTTELLNGFTVTVTGNGTDADMLKILLDNDNITPDASTSDDIFVQIVYEMKTAIGGRYEFGFVTADYDNIDTDMITHGDRSEAYGTYDPDANTDTDAWRFNELKITVDSTAINVVVRVDGKIEINNNQSFVYNGQQMSAADVTEQILNALQYTYNGFAKKENDTLTIKWYDKDGNELSEVPKNVGTYQIGIFAAQTTYYNATEKEVRATFTITPYEIFVVAGDQTFEYTGNNIVLNGGTAQDGIFVKDENGNFIPVDAFVNSELVFGGVVLNDIYKYAGKYTDAITGIFTGDASNYTVNYKNGILTITKAVNEWIGEASAPGGEYSGQKFDEVIFDAEFGKDTAKVEYFYGYQTNDDGTKSEIWKTEAPINAGTYIVRITIDETNNYSGLATQLTLVIKKKELHASGFTFEAIDKIYNGEAQYWSVDPNGDDKTTDAEVWLKGADEDILQYVKFAGLLHPELDCINAGTYSIQAILQISNPNYTFITTVTYTNEEGEVVTEEREVDECTLPVAVKILKLKIVVTPEDQSSIYNGMEPTVSQGQDYVTITLENGSAAPEYVIRDFFGGQIYALAGNTYDPYETYYKKTDKNGPYEIVTLTSEEFENNKNAENPVQYYVLKTVDFVELLTLFKDEGVDAGTYALSARLGSSSNYELIEGSGNFIILKETIQLPELGSVTYNGQEQSHSAPDTELYTIERVVRTDAGVYKVLVSLTHPNNYQWEVDGAEETSDDQQVVWCIEPKKITAILPNAEKDYTYGVTYGEIAWNGSYTWDFEPYARDTIEITFGFERDNDYVFDVGTYYAEVLSVTGQGKDNYIVEYEGGSVIIIPKVITQAELVAGIKSEIKYYTGNAISWMIDDFTIDNSFANVIELISVGATGHTNANGIYENDAFSYHTPRAEYFAPVKLSVNSSNYKLADDIADNTVSIEVFIARATNIWTSGPDINATNLTNIITNAVPKFGEIGEVSVEYFEDEACTKPIDVNAMQAANTYYALFTVAGTQNYSELSTVVSFSSAVIKVKIPVVYWGNATAQHGVTYQRTYNGTNYIFSPEDPSLNHSWYTCVFSKTGEWIDAGTYTITFTLNDTNGQYEWANGSKDTVVFTLVINPAPLTIKPDDLTIVYKSDVPTYTVGASGLMNGETLADLLSSELYAKMNQFTCTYVNGANAGSYDIFSCNNDAIVQNEISGALKNYTVTFEEGILTVTALVVDYDDIGSSDGKTLEDLINDGPVFVYDSESKEVTVENIPEELKVVITYKDKYGNVLPEGQKPENAGEYKVEIQLTVKDDADIGNYQLPDKAEIILTINKAEITITVKDQGHDYNGENYADKFPMSSEDRYSIVFTNGNAFTVVVGDLTIDNGEYINAKTYASVISLNYTENDNYVVTIIKGDLTVNKANNSWKNTLNTKQDIVYDTYTVKVGEDFNSESIFGKETVRYIFYVKDGNGWREIAGAPANAGEYAVEAYVPGNDNYYELVSARVEFTIQKAIITIGDITFDGAEVYYNGESHSIYVAESAKDLFTIVYEGNGKKNAGDYTVTAIFTPKDTVNYKLEGENSKSATLTINKVKITITAENKESMYGDPIADLTYVIGFVGADGYTSFYESDWGSIVLGTTATSQSNVGDYDITAQAISNNDNYDVAFNKGTYKITKFTGNTITVTAQDVRYLMDLIYSAEALRGENTIKFMFANSEYGEYTETLPKNVGVYYVKATIADTDNYNGVSATKAFEITKATLSEITGITYNKDTATWSAVVTTTDGKTVDCDVSYLVGTESFEAPVFKATSAGNFSVIAVPSDENNYNSSAEVSLATVYSISFADTDENHDRQPSLAVLTAPAFATQYRFAGQAVTRPSSIDSNAIPTVVGYKFREWVLGNSDYNFALGVNSNITLYADWTVVKYTVTFYNDATEDKIENGVFVPGTPNYVGYHVIEVEYGKSITLPVDPTRADVNNIFIYTFSHWSENQGGAEITDMVVKGDLSLYAVYDWETGAVTITYMISVDGASYQQHRVVTVTREDVLEILADKPWFIEDGWYTDAERTIRIESLPVVNITLYGAYVFDIGAGDVNADGEIDVDDITLYRRWIVGGYNIVSVAPGSEWNLVNSADFDTNTVYFIERVNDANRDDSGDIRDITTVRMALTGGYGYTYVSGLDSLAGVSGEGVVIESLGLSNVDTTESFKVALEKGGIIQLTGDIDFSDTVTLSKDTVIYLNGHELDMSANSSRPFNMASNARLVIYGENATVKVGNYGFVNIPIGTDNVEVILNGGNYIAGTDNGSFIKPRGEGAISIELNDVNLTDSSSQNYVIDASSYYGDKLSVNIAGGSYDVWTGFVFGGPATNEFVLNDVMLKCRYQGVSVGGDKSNEIEKAGCVTINDCTITLSADLTKNTYSQEMGCVVAGYGAQIEVNDSELSSNVHIASICSGNGACVIEINDCAIAHDPIKPSYSMCEFFDEGKILLSYHVSTEDALVDAFANGGSITLEADITLDQALVLDNGKNVTINLNGRTLTMGPENHNNYVAVVKNGTLTIEGEGTVIVPGLYGFGTASDTTTGHIVINGGTFIGDTAEYLFACYKGSITINGGNFKADYCVLNNFTQDGDVAVRGGTFEVTADYSYALVGVGDIIVDGEPTYLVHKDWNLFSAFYYGGKVVLLEDVTLSEDEEYWEYLSTVYEDVTIDLNGHTLTLLDSAINVENVTLTIEGDGDVVVYGPCGFKTTNDGHIVINGGNFTAIGDNSKVFDGTVIDNREINT